MSNVKKLMMSAAGGSGLNVEEVFSAHVYRGNGSSQTITNGIDLSTEGGMVWTKGRSAARGNNIWDSERSLNQVIMPDQGGGGTFTEGSTIGVTSFNTDGFTLGGNVYSEANIANTDYISWTFRKAPGFFDVVSYTGNGTNGRTISHNLGTTVGCIIVKNLSQSSDWAVYHRGAWSGVNPSHYFGKFNDTSTFGDGEGYWNDTEPTDSVFTVGTSYLTNSNNNNYVAYLFAHNDGDGVFGASGDQDIIKCGYYDGNASANGNFVELGWEPQLLIIKGSNESANWTVLDSKRGLPHNGQAKMLASNVTLKETDEWRAEIFPTGFRAKQNQNYTNAYGGKYTYIAIRRPMGTPDDVNDLFDVYQNQSSSTVPAWQHPFPVDLGFYKQTNSAEDWWVSARLMQDKTIRFNSYAAELTSNASDFHYEDGWLTSTTTDTGYYSWALKRAPGFFDVTVWNVDGTGNQTIKHNLGVVPEMVWTKNRSDSGSGSGSWFIAHDHLTGWDSSNENDRHVFQNFSTGASAQQGYHRDFTSTSIRLLSNAAGGYTTSHVGIAFLFATLPGISKVGSYTGDGTNNRTIDCGFSSGTQFLILKNASSNSHWLLFDSARGISTGNDPFLEMNDNSAQTTSADFIDPANSGFIVNSGVNSNGHKWIFYAIAA